MDNGDTVNFDKVYAGNFDNDRYIAANQDLVKNKWQGTGFEHWVHFGIGEGRPGFVKGRSTGGTFHGATYLAIHRDVADRGMDALQHLRDHGWREDRAIAVQPGGDHYRDELDCGVLVVRYCSKFVAMCNDRGSGADRDGSFWAPLCAPGFHALGYYARRGYDDPTDKAVVLTAKAGTDPNALRPPIDYQLVWTDAGSGGDLDWSVWMPVPQAGYVALGAVAVKGHAKPRLNPPLMMCVKEALTGAASVGDEIYADRGSGAHMDLSTYRLQPVSAKDDLLRMTVGSFHAQGNYDAPTVTSLRALKLPSPSFVPPSMKMSDTEKMAYLTTQGHPSKGTVLPYQVVETRRVPFLAIDDPELSDFQKLESSPFYTVETCETWKVDDVQINPGNQDMTIKTTVTNSYTKEDVVAVSALFGVKQTTTVEAGVELEIVNAKASTAVEISFQLGLTYTHSESTTYTVSSERTEIVSPKSALVVWLRTTRCRLKRQDGSVAAEAGFSAERWPLIIPMT